MIITDEMNAEKKDNHFACHELVGITSFTTYPSGVIKECKLNQYNQVKVKDKIYIPRYKKVDERKKDNKIMSFYENGNIKSIALEEISKVETSIGTIKAELITFYEDGEIDSVFPLNGQIGFGWSIEDEEKLLVETDFSLPIGTFSTKLIGARFYQDGSLKSMILWPNERIELDTPIGTYPARIGFRLYEDGSLQSFEPATPISINTPIGTIMAFDQHAVGIDADYNSIRFNLDGTLQSLSTNSDIVVSCKSTKERTLMYQQLRLDMTSDEMIKLPVVITFLNDQVTLDNGAEKKTFEMGDAQFLFLHDGYYVEKKCSPGSDCSGCGASCM